VTLQRPLVLDLSSVAKGLAIDLAVRALEAYSDVCVEAGGDLYVKGGNEQGARWRIGIQHPRLEHEVAHVLSVTNCAVCTSGDYARRQADGKGHHLLDARSGQSPQHLASATVLAPTALAADGLATAAFVLGPERGQRLLEAQGVHGVFLLPSLALRTTRGIEGLVV
jgi:thiamine biosynthesis lipoprotein